MNTLKLIAGHVLIIPFQVVSAELDPLIVVKQMVLYIMVNMYGAMHQNEDYFIIFFGDIMKFIFFYIVILSINLYPQWESRKGNLPDWYSHGYAMDALDSLTAVVAADQSGYPSAEVLFKTTDGGNTWTGLLGSQSYSVIDVSIVDQNHIWIVTALTPNQILATTDGGLTWQKQYEAPDSVTYWFNYIKMFDLNNGIAEGDAPNPAIGKPAAFLKTTDGGANWILLDNPFIDASSTLWYQIDFISPEIGFYKPSFNGSSKHVIYKTTDGGYNWTELNDLYGWVSCLNFYDEQYGLVHMYSCFPYTGTYIMRTTNSGASWDSIFLSMDYTDPGIDFEFAINDPSKVWLISRDSLFFSADSGKTWARDSLSSSFRYARDLVMVDGDVCWFLCESVYRNLHSNAITSTKEQFLPVTAFSLSQNYPNPFNPVTTINYEIDETALVAIKIYDIIGSEIAVLVNEEKSAGKYSIKFNASDLSSGVYFYRLNAGNQTLVKQMVLLK